MGQVERSLHAQSLEKASSLAQVDVEDNESIAGHEGGADEMFLAIEPAAAAAVSVRSEPG